MTITESDGQAMCDGCYDAEAQQKTKHHEPVVASQATLGTGLQPGVDSQCERDSGENRANNDCPVERTLLVVVWALLTRRLLGTVVHDSLLAAVPDR